MKRTMWALTYCYEGADNSDPYAVTIAVSEDVELLKREMQKCVDEDCEIEVDDFVIPAEVVDANEDEQVIIDYVAGVEYEITPNNQ